MNIHDLTITLTNEFFQNLTTFKPPQTHSNLQTQTSAKPIYEPLSTKEQKKETRIYSSETSLKDDIPLEKHAKVKLRVRLEQNRHSTIIILCSLF